MKKLLLLSAFLIAMGAQAQDFWTQYSTGQSAVSTGIKSISIVDNNVAWLNMACGTASCTPIRQYAKTTNGGTAWTTGVVDLGPNSANLAISNIAGVSATTAYAAVYGQTAGNVGGIYQTVNGGATWIRQATATFNDAASFADAVYFWNANQGVAVGDPDVGGYFEIYTTANGGTTWTRVAQNTALTAVAATEYGLTNQFTVEGNNIWLGTTFGRILKSADKGITWTATQSPILDFGGGINGAGSGDLAFTSDNNGLLQGGGDNAFSLWATSDGGTTWTVVPQDSTTNLRNFGIAAIPGLPNTYVSVGEDLAATERGSSYTTDGGINWVNINLNDSAFVQGGVIKFLNDTTGFASGFSVSAAVGGIYKWNSAHPAFLATQTFSNDNSVTVSPNPTKGSMLNITSKNISQVTVYDILGKQVLTNNYSALNNVSLDLGSLTNGVYMVKVANDMGTSTIKVVKN